MNLFKYTEVWHILCQYIYDVCVEFAYILGNDIGASFEDIDRIAANCAMYCSVALWFIASYILVKFAIWCIQKFIKLFGGV